MVYVFISRGDRWYMFLYLEEIGGNVYLFMLMVTLRRVTTLCVLPVRVAMGARGSDIHDIYFPGARGLGIH